MKILIEIGPLVIACLLTSGCMTDEVIKMNTKEISHFIAKEAYLHKKDMIYVRFGPTRKPTTDHPVFDSLSLWELNENVSYKYGTQSGIKFVTYGSKTITSESTSDKLPDYPYPHCEMLVNYMGFKTGEWSRAENIENKGSQFEFGSVDKLCDGIDLLAVRNNDFTTSFYIKVKDINNITTYNKYESSKLGFEYGEQQTHLVLYKYILMPFAVVADIVTFPFQLIVTSLALTGSMGR